MQANDSRSGTSYHKATLLSRIQLHLAEIEREMASTKAEVLGSCTITCNWVSQDILEHHQAEVGSMLRGSTLLQSAIKLGKRDSAHSAHMSLI